MQLCILVVRSVTWHHYGTVIDFVGKGSAGGKIKGVLVGSVNGKGGKASLGVLVGISDGSCRVGYLK